MAGGLFIAKQKDVLCQGWKALFPKPKSSKSDNEFASKNLPNVAKGHPVDCIDTNLNEKNQPIKAFYRRHFTWSNDRYCEICIKCWYKKVLSETDGLGTEATWAGIIELLLKRQFLTRKGKEIHATQVGRQLINSLPEQMVLPDDGPLGVSAWSD